MVLVAIKKLIFGDVASKPLLAHRYDGYHSTEASDCGTVGSVASNLSTASAQSTVSTSSLAFEGIAHPRVISDVIIGLSDGLTVPFALTAGLSSLGSTKLVITGGLAELVSGAISMGLGGFLAAKSESEHFHSLYEKEQVSHKEDPLAFASGVEDALGQYKLSPETIKMIVHDLTGNTKNVAAFMVKMAHGVEEPADGRELTSALTIGIAYFFGGFIPMVPYLFTSTVHLGLIISMVVMAFTLFVFGYAKTVLSLGSDCPREQCFWNAVNMLLTGGLAAGAAWSLVRVMSGETDAALG